MTIAIIAIVGMIACLAILMYRSYGQIRRMLDIRTARLDSVENRVHAAEKRIDGIQTFLGNKMPSYKERIEKLERIVNAMPTPLQSSICYRKRCCENGNIKKKPED